MQRLPYAALYCSFTKLFLKSETHDVQAHTVTVSPHHCRLAAQKGADVTIIGRTNRDAGAERIQFAAADLSMMREAKQLGESDALSPDLDVLLLTTGIIAARQRQVLTCRDKHQA